MPAATSSEIKFSGISAGKVRLKLRNIHAGVRPQSRTKTVTREICEMSGVYTLIALRTSGFGDIVASRRTEYTHVRARIASRKYPGIIFAEERAGAGNARGDREGGISRNSCYSLDHLERKRRAS